LKKTQDSKVGIFLPRFKAVGIFCFLIIFILSVNIGVVFHFLLESRGFWPRNLAVGEYVIFTDDVHEVSVLRNVSNGSQVIVVPPLVFVRFIEKEKIHGYRIVENDYEAGYRHPRNVYFIVDTRKHEVKWYKDRYYSEELIEVP